MSAERNDLEGASVTPLRPGGSDSFSLTPRSLDEAMKYAEVIASSDIVPQDYKGKPGNVLIAMQMGIELGLPALQAIQNIAVVNGRPAVYGDSLMAIARSHPTCEYIQETFDDPKMVATCRAKRKGQPEEVRTFSQMEAETAGLWGKNTWKAYPKRMLQMRARSYAVRDVWPDALRGIAMAEEVQDIPPRDVSPAPQADTPRPTEPAALPYYPQDRLDENLPKWQQAIEAGKRSADDIIGMVGSSYQLTEEQKQQIRAAEEGDE